MFGVDSKTYNCLTTNIMNNNRIAWLLRYSEMLWLFGIESGHWQTPRETGVRLFDRCGLQPRVQRTSRDGFSEVTDVVRWRASSGKKWCSWCSHRYIHVITSSITYLCNNLCSNCIIVTNSYHTSRLFVLSFIWMLVFAWSWICYYGGTKRI